jgi:hypothetical protein
MTLENLREMYEDETPDESTLTELRQYILAGGGTQQDVDQFIKLTENAEYRTAIHKAIAEKRLYFFNQWPWFLTFARKVA